MMSRLHRLRCFFVPPIFESWVQFIATKYLRPSIQKESIKLFFKCYFNNHSIITNELSNSWIKSYDYKKLNILLNRNWLWSVLLFELGTLQLMFLLIRFKYWRNKKTPKTVQSWHHQKTVINRQAFTLKYAERNRHMKKLCMYYVSLDLVIPL